jgi:hypothetical protein
MSVLIKCPDCEDGSIYFTECGMYIKEPTGSVVGSFPCSTCRGAGVIEQEEEGCS